MARRSAIYIGHVRHRRMGPVRNAFRYGLFMMYLDLAELPRLFDGYRLWSARGPAPAWFRRGDHLGDPDVPLDEAVRGLVAERLGERPTGPIRLLTHLRYWGYCFNPVSFFYCFDHEGKRVETIVAEVHNTPWNETHPYVLGEALNEAEGRRKRYRFAKDFHVSPFMPMDVDYDWMFSEPGERLAVHMENRRAGELLFDATLTMQRREVAGPALAAALLRHPFMTGTVIFGIHWQALKLWLKRCPYYSHPDVKRPRSET